MCGGGKKSEVQNTNDMIAQQKINANLWNYYLEQYKPLIEKHVSNVMGPSYEEMGRKVSGQVGAEIMKNLQTRSASANPVENAMAASRLAEAGAGAQVQGQGGVRSRKIADVQNLINIGRGEATTAQAGLSDIASESVRSQIANMESQSFERASMADAFGSVSGAISAGYLKNKPSTTKKEGV